MRRLEEKEAAAKNQQSGNKVRGKVTKGASPPPSRGTLWPMTVEDIDLPTLTGRPVPMTNFCSRARELFENFETLMLAPDGEELWESNATVGYSDPALADRRVLLALAVRLWMANMLEVTEYGHGEVEIFSVVKSVEKEERRRRGKLCFIFDLKLEDVRWTKPP